jgi:16S rRNA (uracil1498-N3)-methyltransferase
MPTPKHKARLFVHQPLNHGVDVIVEGKQAHYLANVMRVAVGDNLSLFNGRDGEWLASATRIGKTDCVLVPDVQTRRQRSETGPWLAFAPIKKTAIDFLAEKATELGVSILCPVFTSRTVAGRINLDRLGAHVIEAAEQCGRLTVPEIAAPLTLDAFLSGWSRDRPLILLDGGDRGQTVLQVVSAIQAEGMGNSWLNPGFLIGPEGGFSPSELDLVSQLPFVATVRMGPRTLRCETAALSALACWQAIAGDWRDP